MTRRGFRLLPHTADLRVEVRGRDLPGLFSSCVNALFSLLVDRRRVRPAEERTAEVAGDSPEDQLFLLLRAALLLFTADRFLARSARVTIKGKQVALTVSGEPFEISKHPVAREIKAVTAHALTVKKVPEGILARFVLDV